MNAALSLGSSLALALAGVSGVALAQPATERPGVADASTVKSEWTDLEVRRAVLDELRRDNHGAAGRIDARLDAGVVELLGSTTTWGARDRAERIARVVHGVRAVVMRVRVAEVERTDGDVARDVRRALRSTSALARRPIRVKVNHGVVELDGSIETWDEEQLAERVALNVSGVRFCQNQLVAARQAKRSATELKSDMQSRLAWDPLVQHDPLTVTVEGTAAFLQGTVGSAAEWRRACALAWVKGVTAVDCAHVLIDADHPPDPNLRARWPTDEQIKATFAVVAGYWPSISTVGIDVSVASGVMTLKGTTASLNYATALQGIARCIVGVVGVSSELRGPWSQGTASPSPAPPARRRAAARP